LLTLCFANERVPLQAASDQLNFALNVGGQFGGFLGQQLLQNGALGRITKPVCVLGSIDLAIALLLIAVTSFFPRGRGTRPGTDRAVRQRSVGLLSFQCALLKGAHNIFSGDHTMQLAIGTDDWKAPALEAHH
jgi:hypothetical protein